MKKLTIAIDGYSSCGKSTLAKALAKELNYVFIDSGAMYRGITLFALNNKLVSKNHLNTQEIKACLSSIDIDFELNPETLKPELVLNGENVEAKIRTLEISGVVSEVARIEDVRTFLVEKQRHLGDKGGVVMDGRDIGSVVFPNAELKLFVTADPEIRAERRFNELINRGDKITIEEVRQNLEHRDEVDTTRKISPLKRTDDAIVLDNSNLDREQQLALVLKWIGRIQSGKIIFEESIS